MKLTLELNTVFNLKKLYLCRKIFKLIEDGRIYHTDAGDRYG